MTNRQLIKFCIEVNKHIKKLGYDEFAYSETYSVLQSNGKIIPYFNIHFLVCTEHSVNKKSFPSFNDMEKYEKNKELLNRWLYEILKPLMDKHQIEELYVFYQKDNKFYGLRDFYNIEGL